MSDSNNPRMSFMALALCSSFGLMVASLWLILSNWHGFKGAYLIDIRKLSLTEGVVTHSSMHTSEWRRKKYYHYQIEYVFTVNEKSYNSNKITFNDNYSLNREFAERYINEYFIGKMVVVYYDPRDPTFNVLEPQRSESAEGKLFLLVISILIFILTSVYWCFKRTTRLGEAT